MMRFGKDFLGNILIERIFEIDNGFNLYKKIHYSGLPASVYARYLQNIAIAVKKKGLNVEEYMFKLGYDAAIDANEDMNEGIVLEKKISPYRIALISKFIEMIGFGKMDVIIYNVKKQQVLIRISNHPVIVAAHNIFGKKSLICEYYSGVYCAHINSSFAIKAKDIVETQCVCHGDKFCEWSIGVFDKKTKKK